MGDKLENIGYFLIFISLILMFAFQLFSKLNIYVILIGVFGTFILGVGALINGAD